MLRFFSNGICVIAFLLSNAISAQNIQIGSVTDAAARSYQLMGKIDSSISFTIRPLIRSELISNENVFSLIDSNENRKFGKSVHFANKHGRFNILPVTFIQQFNSHHPYGWNDGSMIAAKGYQTLIRAGIYSSIGPLEVQLQPEFVYASNPSYESKNGYGSIPLGSYQKIFPGQSSIRLSAGPISIGVSTENLWWGPGMNSSLLMSNNAPGFAHVFLGTRKPLKTPIGSIEWQLIGGQLNSDDKLAYENQHIAFNNLPSKSRYINGLAISYQPRWVPGLFVGFTRSIQTYSDYNNNAELNFFQKYVPVIALSVQKKNNFFDDTLYRDQLASFFIRWVFPKEKTELYLEYGFNDYGLNARDYLLGPSHSAAYLAGIKKVIPLLNNSRLELGLEITQMSQSPDWLVRNAGNWYVHSQVFEGYTHQNQIMGAGAGFGANVQSINATWIKGWKQMGLLIERVDRDPQTHANKWVDFSVGFLPQYKYKSMIFSGTFKFVNSHQYAWEKGLNKFNFFSWLQVQFLF